MPKLRNPGLYSFLLLLALVALVAYLHHVNAPEAGKLGGEIGALVIAAFAGRSALATRPKKEEKVKLPPPHPRKPAPTWPGDDDGDGPETLREPGADQ